MVTACSDQEPEPLSTAGNADQYLNITINVSGGQDHATRSPKGGEDGDGREAGLERENAVSGITLILYKDEGTTIDFVNFYPVTPVGGEQDTYTTGNRLIANDALDFKSKYHAIVIANSFMQGTFKKGDAVSKVKNYTLRLDQLYTGSRGSETNFVMTGQSADAIDFAAIGKTEGKDMVYELPSAITIQRLAARIDFNTAGGTFSTKDAKGQPYDKPGYKYTVEGSTDVFVVERITPFNLNNETEYLLRHDDGNYVKDPKTDSKSGSQYLNPIASEMGASTFGTDFSTDLKMSDGNIILYYPMENTLLKEEKLYDYATGLAIQGTFYTANDVTKGKVRKTFYGYLRHKEETTDATSYPIAEFASLDKTQTSAVEMNYGIVRNNIYRVSIEKISPLEGGLKLKIAIHDWMKIKHPVIYS